MEADKLKIPIDGETVEFDTSSAALYTYLGKCAIGLPLSTYDHVFLIMRDVDEDNEPIQTGLYLWSYEEIYPEVKEYIENHDYPQHLNSPIIDPYDVKMFEIYTSEPEIFPEDWATE